MRNKREKHDDYEQKTQNKGYPIQVHYKKNAPGSCFRFYHYLFFVFSEDESHPDRGKYWMIRPLIITALAGAFGILSFYLKKLVRPQSKFLEMVVFIFSFISFLIALWLGTILGLTGTMWN